VVWSVARSQPEPTVINHDSICVMNKSYIVKNIDVFIGSALVESNFLANMSSLHDIIFIVDSLHGLQDLNSPNSKIVLNSLTFKELDFAEK